MLTSVLRNLGVVALVAAVVLVVFVVLGDTGTGGTVAAAIFLVGGVVIAFAALRESGGSG